MNRWWSFATLTFSLAVLVIGFIEPGGWTKVAALWGAGTIFPGALVGVLERRRG